MPKTIILPTYKSITGKLTVIEKKINFKIKRVYFIYNIKGNRGGHKHKKNCQFIISLNGSCNLIVIKKKKNKKKIMFLKIQIKEYCYIPTIGMK